MSPHRVLGLCYAASGASGLIYQVAWVRLFTLSLGHTVAASSTVLAAFMGGLALGAWVAGRLPPARSRSLATYAALELFIAAAAIALPGILAAFDPLLVWAYADGTVPMGFATVRVAVSLILLGIPAAAMGATYPITVSWLAHSGAVQAEDRHRAASDAGRLYAVNTAGAAAGTIAAGFWLIPSLGIRGTTWIAVALNIAAAGGALWLARAGSPAPVAPVKRPRTRRSVPVSKAVDAPRPALAAAAAAISGFAALVYEVAWTRLLALIIGPTTYAFAIMATSFITGIAIGSSFGVRLARHSSRVSLWLAAMLLATAISTLLAAWFTASQLPIIVARQTAESTAFGPLLLRQALAIMILLMPASVSLGATFTLALATASPTTERAARATAGIYTSNTIAAVAGALIAGFLLIPQFGLQATFVHTSRALVVAGTVIAVIAAAGKQWSTRYVGSLVLAGAAVAVLTLAVPAWDRDLMTSGAYKYSRLIPADDLEWSLRAGHLEYYKEGAAGTVSVRRVGGTRSLAIDGKVDASNAGDMLTQRLLGLLPTLLHPEPRDALVIGLGSGVTADAALASGEVQQLDVVEISAEVVEASAYFERENHGVLRKPGVRLLIGDGRSHLRLSDRRYDVIISEPSNPWMAGVAALFTREFFEAVRARLRSGGVFCQWAHTYEMAEQDLRSIVHTFSSVFPDGTMWLVGESDLLLIGSVDANMESRLASIARRSMLGSVPTLLTDIAIGARSIPFVLLSLFAVGPHELAAFGSGAAIQTDDRMSLEFTAARAMYTPPKSGAVIRTLTGTVPKAVADIVERAGAGDWSARGHVALRAKAFRTAHESFRRALALDSRSPDALRGSTDAAAGAERLVEETEFLKGVAAAEPDNAAVRVELSHALATLGSVEEAIAAGREAARLDPERPEPLEQLASVFADVGDPVRLAPLANELVQRFPSRSDGRYYQAAALFLASRSSEAERTIRAMLSANPRHAKGQNLLGAVCASLGNHECAETAFAAALQLDPDDPSVYVNLGHVHLERGNAAAAAQFFTEALAIDTRSEAARSGLSTARAAQQ
jgi:spermidine synthase